MQKFKDKNQNNRNYKNNNNYNNFNNNKYKILCNKINKDQNKNRQ